MMNLRIGTLSLSDGFRSWLMTFEPGSEPRATEEVGLRADLNLVGTREEIEITVETINRQLEQAIRAQEDRAIDKVYIEANTGSGWMRSEIVDGVLEVDTKYYDRLNRNHVPASLLITRKNWWEGAEIALPIGNINNGVVLNCNDGTGTAPNVRTNAATITANLIKGDLPTPARLEIKNQYSRAIGSLWVGLNKTRPNWLSGWMLEAENAIGVTPVSAAGASGGAVAQGQLSYGSAQPILKWALDNALITMMRGQRLRLLLRPYYLGAYSVFKHKLKITSGVTVVYETDWIRPSAYYARHWLDMFDVRMPPWLEGKTNLDGLTLELWATPTRAGTWTWAFDDLMMFAQDGFVTLDTFTEPGGKVVIDGDQGWSEDAAGKKSGLRKFVGSLELTPMAFHLFYFAMHSTTMNDAPTDFAALVSGSYRPRRLTL
jgi:hypothetical protein